MILLLAFISGLFTNIVAQVSWHFEHYDLTFAIKFSWSGQIIVVIYMASKYNKITFMFYVQHNQGTGGYSSFKVTVEDKKALQFEFKTSAMT